MLNVLRNFRLGYLLLIACVAIALIGVVQEIYTIRRILDISGVLNLEIREIAQVAYFMTIFGVVASFIVSMILLRFIGTPILELVRVCRKVMRGDQASRVQIRAGGEIGLLALSFNRMLEEIEEKNRALLDYQNNLEEKLKQSQKSLVQAAKLTLVGEMASTVAHDLRNPLSVVSGYSEYLSDLIKNPHPDLAKIAECADKIQFATQRVDWMIDRMNQFNHNKGDQKTTFSIFSPIDSALLFTASKLQKNQVEISVTGAEQMKLLEIHGDLGRIEQVFANLFSNAADVLKSCDLKKLNVSVSSSENLFTIRVKDSGPGISSENMQNLFKPYFTTKNVGEGTGLGLSICKTIVEEHEGEIKVESAAGTGTTFSISLPLRRSKS